MAYLIKLFSSLQNRNGIRVLVLKPISFYTQVISYNHSRFTVQDNFVISSVNLNVRLNIFITSQQTNYKYHIHTLHLQTKRTTDVSMQTITTIK